MKYAQHRSNIGSSNRKVPWKILAIILGGLIVILGLLFLFFRGDDSEQVQEVAEVQVEEEDLGISVEMISNEAEQMEVIEFEEITLAAVDSSGSTGIARRGSAGDLFTHVVVAEMPAIDLENFFYEGWLVRPGIVDFFSTGEMFPREDGKWGLVWETNLLEFAFDVPEFSKVVITLEPRDDDPAPAVHHVLEGEF